jgi:hypothetical protein
VDTFTGGDFCEWSKLTKLLKLHEKNMSRKIKTCPMMKFNKVVWELD